MTPFRDVPTAQLAAETLERADHVHVVTDAAWQWALVSYCIIAAGIIILGPLLGGPPESTLPLVFTVASPALILWLRSLWRCRQFTAEMKARTAELKQRRQ